MLHAKLIYVQVYLNTCYSTEIGIKKLFALQRSESVGISLKACKENKYFSNCRKIWKEGNSG